MATGTGTGWTWGTWTEDQGEEEDEETEYQPSAVKRGNKKISGALIRTEKFLFLFFYSTERRINCTKMQISPNVFPHT